MKPSKQHILKVFVLGIFLILIGVFAVQLFMPKPTSPPKKQLPLSEIYIKPEWPQGDENPFFTHLTTYLKGDKSQLNAMLRLANEGSNPLYKYYLSEVYLLRQQPDSLLTFLPTRFDDSYRDRMHYLTILGYYYYGEKSLALEAMEDLPTDTPRDYLMVYNMIKDKG